MHYHADSYKRPSGFESSKRERSESARKYLDSGPFGPWIISTPRHVQPRALARLTIRSKAGRLKP